jgi:heme A synthase
MSRSRFSKFAWALLAYNIPVILWGAFVRASRSGDGCGDNWPHCGGGGEYVPTGAEASTWIEWTHRVSTMVLGPLLLILAVWAFRAFSKGDAVRKAAVGVFVFTMLEAWIGRHLVLNKLVVDDASWQRAFWMSLHLANILSLLASLTLTAWWSSGNKRLQLRSGGKLTAMWTLSLVGVVLIAITGALSALGDTLYPVSSLAEGVRQDFAHDAALILKTRPLHPLSATLVSALVAWTLITTRRLCSDEFVQKVAPITLGLLGGQYLFGWFNLLMLAPIWMQLTHLLLANLLWIGLVLTGAAALSEQSQEDRVLEVQEHEKEVREWSKQVPSVS